MSKKHLLQRLSWRQAPKNIIMHFPDAITHRLPTHKPLTLESVSIDVSLCYMQYLILFMHKRILPDKIFSGGGPKIDVFVCFLILEIEFLTIYEVSRPLHRRKPFVETFPIIPRLQGTISTSTGSLNLLPNFNSVCLSTR